MGIKTFKQELKKPFLMSREESYEQIYSLLRTDSWFGGSPEKRTEKRSKEKSDRLYWFKRWYCNSAFGCRYDGTWKLKDEPRFSTMISLGLVGTICGLITGTYLVDDPFLVTAAPSVLGTIGFISGLIDNKVCDFLGSMCGSAQRLYTAATIDDRLEDNK